ncbi:hypothetical protein B0H19DRAFT_1243090 [Mycena capillaripes]|nr:hypothetical protein B0H19DRAFT_1243090 [Mycena capillaripes]
MRCGHHQWLSSGGWWTRGVPEQSESITRARSTPSSSGLRLWSHRVAAERWVSSLYPFKYEMLMSSGYPAPYACPAPIVVDKRFDCDEHEGECDDVELFELHRRPLALHRRSTCAWCQDRLHHLKNAPAARGADGEAPPAPLAIARSCLEVRPAQAVARCARPRVPPRWAVEFGRRKREPRAGRARLRPSGRCAESVSRDVRGAADEGVAPHRCGAPQHEREPAGVCEAVCAQYCRGWQGECAGTGTGGAGREGGGGRNMKLEEETCGDGDEAREAVGHGAPQGRGRTNAQEEDKELNLKPNINTEGRER